MVHEIILSNTTDLLRVSAHNIMAITADGNSSIVILNDGDTKCVAFQMGELERIIYQQLNNSDGAPTLVRVGRSCMINLDYLYAINLPKKKLIMRSDNGYKHTLYPSRDALRELKEFIENHKISTL
ncbi:MAG: LytTR family transcriptional regulator DNA-binding domain-containing protein [Muribaculaceae bacterium]|nr:LytTR family transcriptional regulator DNA-binding domain-containing protein [Muribaculaceae bacterium]